MNSLWQDVVYALRTMRNNPAFTLTAVLTLALGIGGNTAIFTVIRAVLLKPLDYREPDRLVRVSVDYPLLNEKDVGFNLIRYEEFKAAAQSFSETGAVFIAREDLALSGRGEPESIKVARVAGNFLHILGTEPAMGRAFLPEEDVPGGRAAVMISTELWQRHFDGDPLIAGKTVTLNSVPSTIVGVLPRGFAFPMAGIDAWVPRPSEYSGVPPQVWRSAGYLVGLGRLKPHVTLEQARTELELLSRQYGLAHSNESRSTMRIALVRDQLVANVRPMLWMLFGAVGFVLLIACANVASLLLARATSRSREFAVRSALGAPRGRLIRQLLTESLLLASIGGALAIVLAQWVVVVVIRTDALNLPRTQELRLDSMVLVFTVGLSMAAGVLFGLFPSLNVSRPDLVHALRTSGSPAQGSARGVSVRGLLVVAQAALSVVLLIGAALLLESFARVAGVDLGFRPENLLTMQIALPPSRYFDWRKQEAFFDELIERVTALPGVDGVAVTRTLPMAARISTAAAIAELPTVPLKDRPQVQMQTISPAYFQTLKIALRRGRPFDGRDGPDAGVKALIINESLARRFWPSYPNGQDPIGQHVLMGNQKVGNWEIVGVVAAVHEGALDKDTTPELYLPLGQNALSTAALVARTKGDPHKFVNSIRAQVLAIDRDQAVSNVKTMDEIIRNSVGQRRVMLVLLGSFAVAALLLATIGIYGIVAYSVVLRTKEMGIRRALGAQQSNIFRLVLGRSLGLVLGGIAIGTVGAFALTRVMKTMLFQVSATDPSTFAGIAALFIVVALGAGYIPARRATHIDPMTALRQG